MTDADTRASLTDSPWFWGYVFACAACVALLLALPKYMHRQRELELEFAARVRAGQTAPVLAAEDSAARQQVYITLKPLLIGTGLVAAAAGTVFIASRTRRPR